VWLLINFQTYEKLVLLLKTHGAQEFGRICQGLLEFALRRKDFNTRGRWTERPDILAEKNGDRYAISSQASEDSMIGLRRRDLDGILEYQKRGYVPCLAILIMEPNLRWIMIRADGLKPGEHSKHALRAHEIVKLTDEVNSAFPSVVNSFFDVVAGRGAAVLRERLTQKT
jgi:Holliday junction resolvase